MQPINKTNVKVLRTRSGLTVSIDDTAGQESLTVQTPQGQEITLQSGSGSVTFADSNGNVILLSSNGIEIRSPSTVTISAASKLDINCPVVNVHGVLTADTLIANSVVGNSYTPGAGNIW